MWVAASRIRSSSRSAPDERTVRRQRRANCHHRGRRDAGTPSCRLRPSDYARSGETALLESMVQAGLPVNLADTSSTTRCSCWRATTVTPRPRACCWRAARRSIGAIPVTRRRSAAWPSRASPTSLRLLLAARCGNRGRQRQRHDPADVRRDVRTDRSCFRAARRRCADARARNRYGLSARLLGRTTFLLAWINEIGEAVAVVEKLWRFSDLVDGRVPSPRRERSERNALAVLCTERKRQNCIPPLAAAPGAGDSPGYLPSPLR